MPTVTFICFQYAFKHMRLLIHFFLEAVFYLSIIIIGVRFLNDGEQWNLGLGLAFGSCVSFFTRGLKILKEVLTIHRTNCGFMVLDRLEQIEESEC